LVFETLKLLNIETLKVLFCLFWEIQPSDNQILKPQESYHFRLSKKFTPPFFGLVIYNLYQASYQVRKQFAAGDIE